MAGWLAELEQQQQQHPISRVANLTHTRLCSPITIVTRGPSFCYSFFSCPTGIIGTSSHDVQDNYNTWPQSQLNNIEINIKSRSADVGKNEGGGGWNHDRSSFPDVQRSIERRWNDPIFTHTHTRLPLESAFVCIMRRLSLLWKENFGDVITFIALVSRVEKKKEEARNMWANQLNFSFCAQKLNENCVRGLVI